MSRMNVGHHSSTNREDEISSVAQPAAKPLTEGLSIGDALFSIKVFLAAMLAYWIAIRFGLDRPYWAVGTAYIVSQPLSGMSTSKAVYRLLGTVMGCIVTLIILPALINAPELLILTIAFWVAFCLYISLLDRSPRSYAFMLAGYTTLITSMSLVVSPSEVFDFTVSRMEEIGLGVICAALVNRVVFPSHAGPVLVARVDDWLRSASALSAETLRRQGHEEGAAERRRQLAADAVDLRGLTTHVAYDTARHQDQVRLLRTLQQRMVVLLPLLSALRDQLAALEVAGDRDPSLSALTEDISTWVETARADLPQAEGLRRRAREIEQLRMNGGTWADDVAINLARRLAEFVGIWSDCAILRNDISSQRVSQHSKALMAQLVPSGHIHRDHGMAGLSALCAGLAIIGANVIWIVTAWPSGASFAQMSGVFCCILATLDNPVPAMRHFLKFLICAMIAASVYQFALFPMLDGFVPLVALLGLLLIPVGTLLARPATMATGKAFCLNFPFMLSLQSELHLNFESFLNNNIATALAMIFAMVMTGIIRAIGATASARRILHMAWLRLAQGADEASDPSDRTDQAHRSRVVALTHRMVDTLGVLAPRLAAIPPGTGLSTDIMRDLRVAINIADLQHYRSKVSDQDRGRIDSLLSQISGFYRNRRLEPDIGATSVVARIDDCLGATFASASESVRAEIRVALAAIRLGLVPDLPFGVGTQAGQR
ncbi:FUSC family protein [Paracoccus sp. MBLB3053]|uniref:FUSC family protein n=1 Tax=Paracoccus aurantius TaxID=3073814 RepID=A0ABU2HYQ2_9RHOB|nr:FUSC family protein [Paracoccus sp. MBLB3053]MDS9470183.1 FUSC family protein [Paracoccus sp. MBLB3053]